MSHTHDSTQGIEKIEYNVFDFTYYKVSRARRRILKQCCLDCGSNNIIIEKMNKIAELKSEYYKLELELNNLDSIKEKIKEKMKDVKYEIDTLEELESFKR